MSRINFGLVNPNQMMSRPARAGQSPVIVPSRQVNMTKDSVHFGQSRSNRPICNINSLVCVLDKLGNHRTLNAFFNGAEVTVSRDSDGDVQLEMDYNFKSEASNLTMSDQMRQMLQDCDAYRIVVTYHIDPNTGVIKRSHGSTYFNDTNAPNYLSAFTYDGSAPASEVQHAQELVDDDLWQLLNHEAQVDWFD